MTDYTWDGAQDAATWEDGRNWGEALQADYPKTNNDKATVPAALAHSIVTAGAITIGELDMQTGATADIALGGDLTVDDAGSENGKITLTAGSFDANGNAILADALTFIFGGTLICGSGNHTFGKSGYTADWGLYIRSGTFSGGSGNHTVSSARLRGGTVTLTTGEMNLTGTTTANHTLRFGIPTFDDANGTVKFSKTGVQILVDPNNTTRTLYNVTVDGSGNTVQFANGEGFDLIMDNNFAINDGELDTSEEVSGTSRDIVVNGTSTIGNGAGAASSAKFTCNSSDVDLNGALVVDDDGELSPPDSSGVFTLAGDFDNSGVVTNNGGTFTIDGTSTINNTGTVEPVFYNLTASAAIIPKRDITIQNTLTVANGQTLRVSSTDRAVTVTLGTTTSAGSIVTQGMGVVEATLNTVNMATIAAASSLYPCVCTGNDWNWDRIGSSLFAVTDMDYRIAATTGGNGVTITSTRCKFPRGMTISSGDVVKIATNTASGFLKVEGAGTLQVVTGGGVVILDGIDDSIDLSTVPLPTDLNPAQICCDFIEGVSS